MVGNKNFRSKMESVLLSLPAFLIYSFIIIYPMVSVFYMSFFKWNGIPSSSMEFTGLRNYIAFFMDNRFYTALRNIGIFILSGFLLILPVAFFLATVIQSKLRGKRFLRTSYFFPQVISRTAIALMWYFLLYPEGGPVASLFHMIGLNTVDVNFLGSKIWAIYAITVINAWTYAGFNMLIFSAGLTSIPEEIYEAAVVDGVNPLQKLVYITVPMMKSSFQLFVINCVIGSITTFEMVYATTGGGPGSASEVFGTLLYKNAFTYNNYGYSNAIGSFLIIASFGATLILNFIFSKRDRD
ncbi:carbohydrate ABC transporter permease [Ruminiclostridium cellobioparum]|uniref:carbohydrate ABC transporter permease n=2 Tax=Ruminiclostridium cellobioparum TaxID=29355 RepID=UPI000AE78665|nr:sugar ABC transporter permease [Ruminiclostridium cellobioparum]